jgi:hypothetical protein
VSRGELASIALLPRRMHFAYLIGAGKSFNSCHVCLLPSVLVLVNEARGLPLVPGACIFWKVLSARNDLTSDSRPSAPLDGPSEGVYLVRIADELFGGSPDLGCFRNSSQAAS